MTNSFRPGDVGLAALVLVAALASPYLAVAQASSSGGPFGLRMAMSQAELSRIGKLEQLKGSNVFSIARVPKPHNAFESYAVIFTPSQGLCKVAGIGKTIETSAHGVQLKSAFESMEEALTRKYGNHKRNDFLSPGSIWDEPEDWMMGLQQKDRYLSTFWDEEEKSTLADNIEAISLETIGLSRTSGFLRLSYEFSNFGACSAELDMEADEAL